MRILRWIEELSGHKRMVEELTTRIAARCEPAVTSRIYPMVWGMDVDQIRGYVRARAAMIIGRELNIASSTIPELTDRVRKEVMAAVSERLIRKTIAEAMSRLPHQVRQLRAA